MPSLPELEGKDFPEQVEHNDDRLVWVPDSHRASQVDILNNQLVLENRIKEGAENLLNMQLNVCALLFLAWELCILDRRSQGLPSITSGI